MKSLLLPPAMTPKSNQLRCLPPLTVQAPHMLSTRGKARWRRRRSRDVGLAASTGSAFVRSLHVAPPSSPALLAGVTCYTVLQVIFVWKQFICIPTSNLFPLTNLGQILHDGYSIGAAEQSWKTRANILIGRECRCFFNSLWLRFSFFQEPDSVQRGDCAHGQQVCLVADCDKQLLWILLLLVPIKYNRDTDSSRSSCVLTEASKYFHNKITNKITQNMQFFA